MLVSIRTPALAAGALGAVQPVVRPTAVAIVVATATARRKSGRSLSLGAGPGNVQHNLELEQRRAGGYRVGALTGVGRYGRAGGPGLEGLLGLPLGHHEVAVIALHRPQQLKPEEPGLAVDRMGTVGESFFQFWAGPGRNLDCVDLHHGHGAKVTAPAKGQGRAKIGAGQDRRVSSQLTYCGGTGRPLVLVHGLMGRGSTWSRQLPWLTLLGSVYTYDAPWHRGRDVDDPAPISTERFVAELAAAVGTLGRPAVLIGHSMGGLHAWCLAAARPDLVSALVVEDMAADFVGRTVGAWEPWLHALPEEFDSAETVFAEFGPVAGRYFLEAFDRTETGWRLHGRPEKWIEIAAEWGTRDYWSQWQQVQAPVLLIEAGDSVVPPGQMTRMAELAGDRARYLRVTGAGHLVHDDAPEDYRRAVEDFLGSLPPR